MQVVKLSLFACRRHAMMNTDRRAMATQSNRADIEGRNSTILPLKASGAPFPSVLLTFADNAYVAQWVNASILIPSEVTKTIADQIDFHVLPRYLLVTADGGSTTMLP